MTREAWSASAHDAVVKWVREDARATALAEVRDGVLALEVDGGWALEQSEVIDLIDNLSQRQVSLGGVASDVD